MINLNKVFCNSHFKILSDKICVRGTKFSYMKPALVNTGIYQSSMITKLKRCIVVSILKV